MTSRILLGSLRLTAQCSKRNGRLVLGPTRLIPLQTGAFQPCLTPRGGRPLSTGCCLRQSERARGSVQGQQPRAGSGSKVTVTDTSAASSSSAAAAGPLNAPPTPTPPTGQRSLSVESPFTIPNLLTIARIAACPFLGYAIVKGQYELATGILFVGGFSDWLDGFLARRWNQHSVLGSILDPAADKALMTTLVGTLAYVGLLPLPLAIIIFGRDLALSLTAFYIRYASLPPPKTLARYFSPSTPSAEVQPTTISKVNTALQLGLMGMTTISPLLPLDMGISTGLTILQWTVAGTTIWSGLSYLTAKGFRYVK